MADPRINAFFLLTGVTFLGFASGFGSCLFNLNTVDACVAVANHWVDVFHDMGNHILEWAIAFTRSAFHS